MKVLKDPKETISTRSVARGVGFLGVLGLLLVLLTLRLQGPNLILPVMAAACSMLVAVSTISALSVDRTQPLDSISWMLLGWAMVMVVVPTATVVSGPSSGTLFSIPNEAHMRTALWLQLGGFFSWVAGVAFYSSRQPRDVSQSRPASSSTFCEVRPRPADGVIMVLVLIGVGGLWARFRSFGEIVEYYAGRLALDAAPASPVIALAALICPPALALAGVLLGLGHRRGVQAWVAGLLLVVAGTTVYNYNRGSVVAAIVSYLVCTSFLRRPIKLRTYAVIGTLVLFLALAVGNFRTEYFATEGGRIARSETGIDQSAGFQTTLDGYFRAPAYTGAAVQSLSIGTYYHDPELLLNDVLSPIPRFGEAYRGATTSAVFSSMVRGSPGVVDTAPPLYLEVFMTLGLWAIAPVFFLVGGLAVALRRRLQGGKNVVHVFTHALASVWLGYLLVGSAQFAAQTLVQFGPACALAAYMTRARGKALEDRA